MRTFILATVSAVSMTAGNALYVNRAQAVPMFNGLQDAAPASNIESVQFFFGGRRYRWPRDGKGPAGTGAAMLAAWLRLGRRPWLAWLEFSGSCRWPMAVTVVAASNDGDVGAGGVSGQGSDQEVAGARW